MQPPLSDEVLLEAVRLRSEHPTLQAASDASGIAETTLRRRIRVASKRGLLGTKPVLPGFQITKTTAVTNEDGEVVREFIQQRPEPAGDEFEVPDGHAVKGVSALVDAQGNVIQQWIKTREDSEPSIEDIAAYLKNAFADVVAVNPTPAPPALSTDLLTLLPCGDWHLGMFAWEQEGGVNWDLKIAEDTIGRAVEDTITRSPPSVQAIVLSGGDLLHADNGTNQTSKSGHVLDVDGRYDKVIGVACRLMVRTVDAALRRHGHVTVRILKGNHDRHASVAIAYYLLAYYRNELRVHVDVDPSLFFWFSFGNVLIGATHGDEAKITQMPQIMAHRRAEEWGATKFRYVHGFHLHHSAKFATEGGGVISEVHQTPIPQDAWHFGAGFLSGRSIQAITYHREFGDIGRVRTAVLDGGK